LPKPSSPAALQRVDELLADAPAILDCVEHRRQRAGDHLALDLLHHVERHADDRRVVAHRDDDGHARAAGERGHHPRLAQDVVRAGRQRPTRRAAQHELAAVASQRVGDVRVALADRLDLDLPGAQPALIEVGPQRLEHEQRLTSVGRALLVGEDDVVRRRLAGHGGEP
jgi:hypothetical protein